VLSPDVAVVVVDVLDHQALAQRFPGQHAPAGALHVRRGGRELLGEGLEGAEVLVDRRGQVTVGPVATVRAAWCLSWCSSMISPAIAGSSAP